VHDVPSFFEAGLYRRGGASVLVVAGEVYADLRERIPAVSQPKRRAPGP